MAFVFIFLIGFSAAISYVITDSLNMAACNDYGRTRFHGVVYECKKVETKK